MSHIENLRELKAWDNRAAEGYLKSCKQTEKEVEMLKKNVRTWHTELTSGELLCREIDKTFTHKEAIKEGEKE